MVASKSRGMKIDEITTRLIPQSWGFLILISLGENKLEIRERRYKPWIRQASENDFVPSGLHHEQDVGQMPAATLRRGSA